MKDIKSIINKYMTKTTLAIIVVLLFVLLIVQMSAIQKQAQKDASIRFEQIHQILNENALDLAAVEEDLNRDYIRRAETVAYILGNHADIVHDHKKLQEIATLLGIDEIWIFDQKGTIVSGTNPDYYGLSFDSGEQMAFFKPMLEDKSLQLCQDILPRTADGRPFQYTAVWGKDDEYIVQIGALAEDDVLVMEKYDLSYIFGLLRVNSESEYYAINEETGRIIGTTVAGAEGKKLTDVGLELETIEKKQDGFHATVNGVMSYCVFTSEKGNMIGRTIPAKELYMEILPRALELTAILIVAAFILIITVTRCVDRLIIRNIKQVNEKLDFITAGNLEEKIEINDSLEFSQLSEYINRMVVSLHERVQERERIFNIVARHSNRNLYVYDLSRGVTRPLNKESEQKDVLAHLYEGNYSESAVESNTAVLPDSTDNVKKFFADIHSGVPLGELDIHIKMQDGQIRWYHFMYSNLYEGDKPVTALISVADITEKYVMERRADYDEMTGLLRKDVGENRIRGIMDMDDEKGGILIILDLDDLKGINDNLGHSAGDEAISGIADVIRAHFRKDDIIMRAGGDEFIAFLPRSASSIETVEVSMTSLLQKLSKISVGENKERGIHCSAGCAEQYPGENTYDTLFKRADTALYHVKRNGKNNFAFYEPEMEQKDYEFQSKQLLSNRSSKKFQLEDLQNFLDTIIKRYQLVLSVDISNNTYHMMEEVKDGVFAMVPEFGKLDDFVEMGAKVIHAEHLDRYRKTLSRGALMQAYEQGKKQIECSFLVNNRGEYRTVECLVSLYTNNNGDICDFTMLRWEDGQGKQ